MKKPSFINSIETSPRRLTMWAHRVRVHTVLTMWFVPDRVLRAIAIARAMPRGRQIAAVALAFAVIAPSALYVHERARRIEVSQAYRHVMFSSAAEISTLRNTMGNLLSEQTVLKSVLLEAGYAVYSDNELAVPVVATGYSSSVWETDETPFVTATNTHTRYGIVALSRDLLRRYTSDAPFAFGDIVHISGIGDFIVEDSMNARWRNRVDVWFPSRTAAVTFGRREVILRARVDTPGGGDETAYRYIRPLNLASSTGASR